MIESDSAEKRREGEREELLNASALARLSSSGPLQDAPKLPENLLALHALSRNLYWVWNRRIRTVFEKIDLAAWDGVGHNPVLLLQRVSPARFAELSSNNEFVLRLSNAHEIQREYLHGRGDTWFQKQLQSENYEMSQRNQYLVAYFSAEFGLTECLRTYSGGLGILAGDHLKSASDLGIPIVGVGLFYNRGYFSQQINSDAWQIESYPANIPSELPVEPVLDPNSKETLIISVPIEDRSVRVRAWKIAVGRANLILLDTNLPGLNSKEDCEITAELYGGDIQTRVKQEIILGFGGERVLRALSLRPTVYHMNEGHSAFVILEKIREIMEEDAPGTSFDEAKKIARAHNLFTTHTPVGAGIDVFDDGLVERYLSWYWTKIGITREKLLEMGHESRQDSRGFNMAVLAIRMSRSTNAVSKLHKRVAIQLWKPVIEEEERGEEEKQHQAGPALADNATAAGLTNGTDILGSVTNGVHTLSWVSDSFADIYDEYLGPGWKEDTSNPDVWRSLEDIPDGVLWSAHKNQKAKLIEFIKTDFSFAGYQRSVEQILDSNTLTIGFARRFATYKRATLILSNRQRLSRLLKDEKRPIQLVFAGKAHPKDHEGKKLIQEIINFAKSEDAGGRIVFLPDYDISIARHMTQGVDLWLNNPQRPLEASGTSGMKSLPNGVLNFSILDGWWDEAHSVESGWSINSVEHFENQDKQNLADAEALYSTLEEEIIPEFYERDRDGVPIKWVKKMKHSISTLTPRFTTQRMVKEYSERFYFRGDNGESAQRGS